MSENTDNYYYAVHYKSSNMSFTNVSHTLEGVFDDIKCRAERDSLFGMEITISQRYGWDEQERKELARLKAKYESGSKE